MSARLGARGVDLRAGRGSLSLALLGVGRGGRFGGSGVVSVRAHANRVVVDRGVVREWYAAGPLGIEQGFTVARRPAGVGGQLSLALGLGGSVSARRAGSGVRFVTASGRVAFRYGGLSAVDARGRTLRAGLELQGGRLLVRVWDRGARYPLRIDPLIQQGSKLTGGGEATVNAGVFGFSVAVSADGSTALIGGKGDNSNVGAAWVFTRSGSTWTQQGSKLTGAGAIGSTVYFGGSVALSADGNTALIGGYDDNGGVGAAWVFTRSGSAWTLQGSKLTGGGIAPGTSPLFGYSVALSGDGNTALIGGYQDSSVGAAWVFTRSGSTWSPQGSKLTGIGETGFGRFGYSVALSGDGNTALIGGNYDNGQVGAAWVFTRSGSTWTGPGAKLAYTGATGSIAVQFGSSVALSGDGNTALIGGPGDNNNLGATWAFTRSGSTWTQQGAKLTANDEAGTALFGISVALSGDGNTALIGGNNDNGGIGAAWTFTRPSPTWTQQGAKLVASDETGSGFFGYSVALSPDANTALIGGYNDCSACSQVGAAWAFAASAASQASTTTGLGSSRNPSTVGQSVTFTATVSGASPSGTVNFSDGSTTIGSCGAQPLSGASATCTTSSLAAGSHGITAVYSGDANNAASTSGALLQSVVARAPTTTPPTPPKVTNVGAAYQPCVAGKIRLIDVYPSGGQVHLSGVAATTFAGQVVHFWFAGKQIRATANVQPDGTFNATTPMPPPRVRATNNARYQARIGAASSLQLKLARRSYVTSIASAGGKVTIAGYITRPLAKPARGLQVRQSTDCSGSNERTVATNVKIAPDGHYTVSVPAPSGTSVAFYRLLTQVPQSAGSPRLHPTFTLLRGVTIGN